MLSRKAYASRKKVFAPLSALRVFFKKRAEREAILALPPVPPHHTETLHENPRRAAVARYLNRPL